MEVSISKQFMGKKWVYPEDVIHMFEEIPRQFMPSHVQQGDFLDKLKVCTGLHPTIRNFIGQLFVIVNTMANIPNRFKVYYIDYGTVAALASDTLKFLHEKFCVLPQQAVRTRLCSICPATAKTQWSMEASSRFLDLVHMRIIAHVYYIDFERQILNIFLADTSGDDIYLNDTLVNEGHAIFSNQEQQKINMEPRSTPWVKHIHLLPTFDEIECNAVPSVSEMCQLTKIGMPLELI